MPNPPRKLFSEIHLPSGDTLGERIARLKVEAEQRGINLIVLGWDNDKNKFLAGHVPPTKNAVVDLLSEFIHWLTFGEVKDEQPQAPPPTDTRFS